MGEDVGALDRGHEACQRDPAPRRRPREAVARGIDAVIAAMDACIDRGLAIGGELPGKLRVKRRAKAIHEALLKERGYNIAQPHAINDWLIVYAMAVNEENAAGGRVVTSPTNGAAGVVPSVLRYYREHCIGVSNERRPRFHADGGRDRRHHQAQRLDFRRRGRLPGRGWRGSSNGSGWSLRSARRH